MKKALSPGRKAKAGDFAEENPKLVDGLVFRGEQPGSQFQQYPNHPADNVSWVDATAFCRWLTSRLGYEVRPPTESEWQRAANGGDCRKDYPWGGWDLVTLCVTAIDVLAHCTMPDSAGLVLRRTEITSNSHRKAARKTSFPLLSTIAPCPRMI